jgi:hypothetical protein
MSSLGNTANAEIARWPDERHMCVGCIRDEQAARTARQLPGGQPRPRWRRFCFPALPAGHAAIIREQPLAMRVASPKLMLVRSCLLVVL